MGDNTAQISDWNGIVGQRWAELQSDLDRLVAPYGAATLATASVRPNEKVLDVGCGCGDTSLQLARLSGADGAVLGLDVSAPMLAVARERAQAAALSQLSFMEGDAAAAPLPPHRDLVYSRFGVMFFDDPAAAFRHLRQALKPGGRLAFCCWRSVQENPWANLVVQAVRDAVAVPATPADPQAPGPFAFAERARVEKILAEAGFGDIHLQPVDAPTLLGGTLEHALSNAVRVGPAARLVRELPADRQPIAVDAIRRLLAPFDRGHGVAPPGAVWVVTARNP